MIALLLAAQVVAAQPAQTPNVAAMPVFPQTRRFVAPSHPMYVPDWCRRELQKTDRTGRSAPRKLGELPRANLEYAVDRRVGGCPVATPVHDAGGPIRSR